MQRMSTSGFTIVELIIVILVSGILAGVLFGPLDDLYQSNTKSIKSVAMLTDTRGALRTIQRPVNLATGFLASNNITDPSGTNWNYNNGGNNNVLITSNYATTIDEPVDSSGARTLVYGTDCSTPIQNNYVFFVSGGTLYRRTIRNTASTCAGYSVGQKQTCGFGGVCGAFDAVLLSNVTNFSVQYYASASDTTTTSDPTAAHAVALNVTTSSGNGSAAATATSNLRISRMNGS